MAILNARSRGFVGAAGIVTGLAGGLIITAVVDDNDSQSTQSFAQVPAGCDGQLTLEVPEQGTIYWCDLAPTTAPPTTEATTSSTTSSTTSTSSTTTSTEPATTTTASSTSVPATTTLAPSTTSTSLPPTSSTSTSTTSTTQPPPSTTLPPFNGVDALLRPPPGKLLNGVQQEANGWTGWVSEAGEVPHIYHRYANSSANVLTILNATPQDTIPLVNFKPAGQMGLTAYNSILNGNQNTSIDQAADHIIAYGKPVMVAPMHEPENDGDASADDEYARAWRYVIERMRARGADNIVSVWNMMGAAVYSARYTALYPGDDVVDWIAADLYIITSTTVDTWGEFLNQSGWSTSPTGWYNRWASKGKPMMLAEWGIGTAVVPATPTKMFSGTEMQNLVNQYPLLDALVYWNAAGIGGYQVTNPQWPNGMLAVWVDRPEFQVDISLVAK